MFALSSRVGNLSAMITGNKILGALGIDLGIENIVVDSDQEILENKQVEDIRRKYSRLRSDLQHTGTRSAKRKLKELSGKERHFKKDTTHVISAILSLKPKAQLG
jgi:putative transposase